MKTHISASRIALRHRLAEQASYTVIAVGIALAAASPAKAECGVNGLDVSCGTTPTADTPNPDSAPLDRAYRFNSGDFVTLTVQNGAEISRNGIAVVNQNSGGVHAFNDGTVSVSEGNAPIAGGTAAFSILGGGGPISYEGAGSITNLGQGNGLDIRNDGIGYVIAEVGAVTSASGTGIDAQTNDGSINVTADGPVSAAATGIFARRNTTTNSHSITITQNGDIDADEGIHVENFNGSSTISANGNINASGGNGIEVIGDGGYIYLTQSPGVTINATNDGIATSLYAADLATVDVSGTVIATGGSGIDQYSPAGTNSAVVRQGAEITGVTGADQLTISGRNEIDTVGTIEGADFGVSQVIFATDSFIPDFGDNALTNGGTIHSSGTGVRQLAIGDGTNTLENSGAISGANGDGIFQSVTNGDALLTGAGSITGGENGVRAESGGSGDLRVNGAFEVVGSNGAGIHATQLGGSSGDILVDVQGVVLGASGIVATSSGTGDISVTSSGAVNATGPGGAGYLLTQNGRGDIDAVISGQMVSAQGHGVVAQLTADGTSGTIGVRVDQGASVTTQSGHGIYTDSGSSSGATVIAIAGKVNAVDTGILGRSSVGDINVLITETGSIDPLVGIDLGTTDGTLTIQNAGLVEGDKDGVRANASGTGSIVLTNAGTIRGTSGNGAQLSTNDGDLVVEGSGAIVGGTNGLTMTSAGAGSLYYSGSQTITGVQNGIEAIRTGNGTGVIQVVSGGTVSGGYGIFARNVGSGDISVGTLGQIYGTGLDAAGLYLEQTGTGNIVASINGNVNAAGTGANVQLLAGGNTSRTITLAQAAGSTISAGGANGIFAQSGASTGLTAITVNGTVHAQETGISASSSNGAISVAVGKTGKIDPATGIDLITQNGLLAVNNSGQVVSGNRAVSLVATGSGQASINNLGLLDGGNRAVEGSTNGTAFVLANYAGGTINGAVAVTGSDAAGSAFNNGGTWNARGASSFSGSWHNSNLTNMANGTSLTLATTGRNSGLVNFVGNAAISAVSLTNTGMLEMRNANAGNNVVTLTGNYIGGGQLGMDFSTATATADLVKVSGSVAGNSLVQLNRTGSGYLANGFLPMITAGTAGAAGAFTSNFAFPTSGFLLESFGQNPGDAKQWGIIQNFNPEAGDVINATDALNHMALGLLEDPVSLFINAKQDPAPGSRQIGLWGRGGAGTERQSLSTTIGSGGAQETFAGTVRSEGQVLQVGLDYGLLNMGGQGANLHFGVTGGALDGTAKTTGAYVDFHASFLGGYASFTKGGLTIDALLRHEWRDYGLRASSLFGTTDTVDVTGSATLGQIDAAYRIGKDMGLSITPHLRYQFGSSRMGPIQFDTNSQYEAGTDRVSMGQGGLRLAWRTQAGSNFVLEPSLDATYLRNWSPRSNGAVVMDFASPQTAATATTGFGDAMRYSLGFTGRDNGGRISFFGTAALTDGSAVNAKSFHIGARYNF